ncbi:hypothetical protein FHS23_003073 [Prauserella isguenensis]|uniref:Uncharacterized protein n=1 Tax=Prauserella isguenensis TaxID=1470180 RepID=A0A839S3X5_9PSEU|nr:hypothetical protein [Prauserella isguenensis]MBB3052044.1 hypothetical protein [Prauserella isguenensis]
MAQPITAVYVRDEEDYTVTVAGEGQELTDKAPGIIAARDRADQLIEKIAPRTGGDEDPTVVHLLNGSAFEFTSAYMTARLSRTEAAEQDESAGGDATVEGAAEAAESGEVTEAEAAESDVEESDAEESRAEESGTDADVADEGDAAEADAAADQTPDTEEAAEVTAAEATDADADSDEGTTPQGTAPGSGVPRKEITKSPEATSNANADDDESDGKSYAAAAGTSAAS